MGAQLSACAFLIHLRQSTSLPIPSPPHFCASNSNKEAEACFSTANTIDGFTLLAVYTNHAAQESQFLFVFMLVQVPAWRISDEGSLKTTQHGNLSDGR